MAARKHTPLKKKRSREQSFNQTPYFEPMSDSNLKDWLLGVVGEWITLQMKDGSRHRGVVHTVDPETGNVVLLRPNPVRGCHTPTPRDAPF